MNYGNLFHLQYNREEVSHPGRSIYEDEPWVVCHSLAEMRLLGTLFITSKLQFPFANRRHSKAAISFARIWKKAYVALTKNMGVDITLFGSYLFEQSRRSATFGSLKQMNHAGTKM